LKTNTHINKTGFVWRN